ncbi:MAG: ATP-binding protein [Chloroflexota bacterium]|nr:ATP-binding protein [Chloroflexota bacterium]
MSALIRRLNGIKNACTIDWLTPSQAQTWRELQDCLALGEVVNLHGPIGSGKTFLAWLLIKQHHAIYVTSTGISSLPIAKPIGATDVTLPIVDDYPSTREAHRSLIKQLAYNGYIQAVVLTQLPIHDDCYRVQLTLTKADLDHVRQRLLLLDPELPPRRGGTLHHLINPNLPLDDEETT